MIGWGGASVGARAVEAYLRVYGRRVGARARPTVGRVACVRARRSRGVVIGDC